MGLSARMSLKRTLNIPLLGSEHGIIEGLKALCQKTGISRVWCDSRFEA